jgi:hypothetical protein
MESIAAATLHQAIATAFTTFVLLVPPMDGEHPCRVSDLALRFARFFRKLLTRPL